MQNVPARREPAEGLPNQTSTVNNPPSNTVPSRPPLNVVGNRSPPTITHPPLNSTRPQPHTSNRPPPPQPPPFVVPIRPSPPPPLRSESVAVDLRAARVVLAPTTRSESVDNTSRSAVTNGPQRQPRPRIFAEEHRDASHRSQTFFAQRSATSSSNPPNRPVNNLQNRPNVPRINFYNSTVSQSR